MTNENLHEIATEAVATFLKLNTQAVVSAGAFKDKPDMCTIDCALSKKRIVLGFNSLATPQAIHLVVGSSETGNVDDEYKFNPQEFTADDILKLMEAHFTA
ncbi:hypothetical protein [Thiomicrorhabdus sp. 6S3-12]|uniref:hypothetical protein n=1 Tax=Thiomicrorhabdus sp. 6S3-12 TaxID=2819681 RepID=UPI001AADC424|nr:hypothetical protein [Thiomicrorhabdus sp. 6S3-12]MBO1923639.1 hypothetical protein [Thiomicrorhabdus sp. 6S3-12]